MAIYNGRILMRKGNEADFDPSKLMSGEWAVSLDAGIVRICLEAGKVIRMATYEAFEEDMKQIEAILLECQSIEEAVRRINTEVSEKLNACAEYVQQAKGYSEQAKTSEANAKSYMQSAKTSEENAKVSETNAKASENSAKEYENSAKLTEERAREVFESIPEDYSTISNDLYELAIKENASGEEIHVNDSSNLKLREFALYGKANQNTTSGKNLFPFGDLSGKGNLLYQKEFVLPIGKYTFSMKTNVSSDIITSIAFLDENLNELASIGVANSYWNTRSKISINITSESKYITVYTREEVTLSQIQIESGSVMTEYEKYSGGIASPNPQFPQPIEVAGASGSVVVKSVGKNLLKTTEENKTTGGVTWNLSNDNHLTASGTATGYSSSMLLPKEKLSMKDTLTLSFKGTYEGVNMVIALYDENENEISQINAIYNNILTVDLSQYQNAEYWTIYVKRAKDGNVINVDGYIQLERGAVATEYEPYKETLSTIPTKNGLASVDDIRDVIVKYADGSGEYIQRVGKVRITKDYTFLLNNNWIYSDKIANDFKELSSNSVYKMTKGICSHFKYKESPQSMIGNIGTCCLWYGIDYNGYRLGFNGGFATVEEFKTFLDENEVYFYYPLAEPIITPLTAEEITEIEKLHTFCPITNISNDFDCGMSVTYYADSKNYINNQLAIMKQEQEEAMMNMLLLMPTEVQAMMIENDTNDLLKESEI